MTVYLKLLLGALGAVLLGAVAMTPIVWNEHQTITQMVSQVTLAQDSEHRTPRIVDSGTSIDDYDVYWMLYGLVQPARDAIAADTTTPSDQKPTIDDPTPLHAWQDDTMKYIYFSVTVHQAQQPDDTSYFIAVYTGSDKDSPAGFYALIPMN